MDWTDLLVHVLPSCEGCPETVALDHIVKAARTFAAKSLVYRRSTFPFKTVANQRTYPLDIDDGEELVKVIDGALGADPLTILDTISGAARVRRESSQRFGYVPSGKEDIVLNPSPTLSEDIVLTIALKPRLDAKKVPDELVDYVEDISHGAIASLCALPERTAPWHDEKQSMLHASIFQKRIEAANMLAESGYGARPRRSRINYF